MQAQPTYLGIVARFEIFPCALRLTRAWSLEQLHRWRHIFNLPVGPQFPAWPPLFVSISLCHLHLLPTYGCIIHTFCILPSPPSNSTLTVRISAWTRLSCLVKRLFVHVTAHIRSALHHGRTIQRATLSVPIKRPIRSVIFN